MSKDFYATLDNARCRFSFVYAFASFWALTSLSATASFEIFPSNAPASIPSNSCLDGNKTVAQKIVYGAFDIIKEKEQKDALEVFEAALENVMPVLEVKARRIGGATYQVPIEIRPERRQTLGLRWLVVYARNRHEKTMAEKLAAEIIDAVAGNGGAFKKKEDMHRMAEANKAFAHYKF